MKFCHIVLLFELNIFISYTCYGNFCHEDLLFTTIFILLYISEMCETFVNACIRPIFQAFGFLFNNIGVTLKRDITEYENDKREFVI